MAAGCSLCKKKKNWKKIFILKYPHKIGVFTGKRSEGLEDDNTCKTIRLVGNELLFYDGTRRSRRHTFTDEMYRYILERDVCWKNKPTMAPHEFEGVFFFLFKVGSPHSDEAFQRITLPPTPTTHADRTCRPVCVVRPYIMLVVVCGPNRCGTHALGHACYKRDYLGFCRVGTFMRPNNTERVRIPRIQGDARVYVGFFEKFVIILHAPTHRGRAQLPHISKSIECVANDQSTWPLRWVPVYEAFEFLSNVADRCCIRGLRSGFRVHSGCPLAATE